MVSNTTESPSNINSVIRKLNKIKKHYKDIELFVIADNPMTLERIQYIRLGYISKQITEDSFPSFQVFSKEEYEIFDNKEDFKLVVIIG